MALPALKYAAVPELIYFPVLTWTAQCCSVIFSHQEGFKDYTKLHYSKTRNVMSMCHDDVRLKILKEKLFKKNIKGKIAK